MEQLISLMWPYRHEYFGVRMMLRSTIKRLKRYRLELG